MTTFIDDVVENLLSQPSAISNYTIILPSKRAGSFLIESLSKQLQKTTFVPEILSIENFIELVSGFQTVSNTELLFEFYEVYLDQTPKSQIESFETFSKWAQIILQDFNEIDRYLIPPDGIFDYLNAIKKIENQHWSFDEDQSDYIKNYLAFWNRLKNYYSTLEARLTSQKKGYQGLVYKKAVQEIDSYLNNSSSTYIFAGFNALNTSEERLITKLLDLGKAHIYWDVDNYFLNDPIHDAGLFVRQHQQKWAYLKQHGLKKFQNYYQQPKNIECIGTPKNVGQVKYVGELLTKIQEQGLSLDKTAVVLSDESLLIPLLNSLPLSIGAVNITMGLPLKDVPLATTFENLFNLHINYGSSLYYKDVLNILEDGFLKHLFINHSTEKPVKEIKSNNIVYLKLETLINYSPQNELAIRNLFSSFENNAHDALENFQNLILKLKSAFEDLESQKHLELEYLFRFHSIFNELKTMNEKFHHIKSISTLYSLYKELLQSENLDFKGEPLQGLQIMGMLETRLLDFETVVIMSVNEGILPAGKSNNSFIPFDVKVENDLPTFKEKDAVYTYHFYRLLQRAKNIHILYNTEPDVLGGAEKSRFLTQLEFEGIHHIKSILATPKVQAIKQPLKSVKKTNGVIEKLKQVARQGFSPSSLTNYIRNPWDFYQQKVLGIKEYEEVEESVAANTLGTVLHNTLEDFYKPLEGQFLSLKHLEEMLQSIDKTVSKHFEEEFRDGDLSRGKNLIIFEIAKRYIYNFLQSEIKELKSGNEIKIVAIEIENNTSIKLDGLDFEITLKGKVDRVDEFNGITRIIDYKSGTVMPSDVKVYDWKIILTDYKKYSKSFQLLMYAYMLNNQSKLSLPVEAGIISFKKLSLGVLKFEDKSVNRSGNTLIDPEILSKFETVLRNLILEIFDQNIAFEEKQI